MQGRVLDKLEEVLEVQKRMWLCASKSWHASGARGDRGGARAEAEVAWRVEKKAARRTTVVAGWGATRRIAGK
jgi:hypothetical protein